MGKLITTANTARADDIYQLLVDSYAGLTDSEVGAFQARLVMLLINHVGDTQVVGQAIAEARRPLSARRSS